jgi:DNA-binding TFAR19-related protein (PDSD5 family)
MTLLSGLSGIASLIPGVPDAVGVAGASAKSLGGVTKMANTKINRNAISKLKSDASSNTQLIAALEILDNSIGYWEGAQQTVLGGVEGVGSMFGGVGKWGTSLFSKGVETLPSWGMYAGRAIGSTITSSIDSNAQVKKREEQEKSTQKAAMRAAVNSSVGKPEHIGRLHRLAVLIEPDFAEEMNRAINLLDDSTQLAVKDAIKEKNTWNPS